MICNNGACGILDRPYVAETIKSIQHIYVMSDVPSIDTIPDDQYEDIFEAGGNIYQAIPFSDIGGWAKKYKKHIGVVVAFIFAAYYAYQYFIKGDV